jgi:excisionase family DNA binding protein
MRLRRPSGWWIVMRMQTHPAPIAIPSCPLLTADDVASVLGVPRTFVYSLARRGELPTVRIGERYVRFRAQVLDRWIADQETTARKGTQ